MKYVKAREKSANLVTNGCIDNKWRGVFLKTNVVLGGCAVQRNET